MRTTTLFISAENLRYYTDINDSLDPKLITSNIKLSQEMYLEPLLGTELYLKLQSLIETNSVVGSYKELLEDFIQDTLIWYSYYESLEAIYVRPRNNGLLTPQGGENSNSVDREMYNAKRQSTHNRAEYYSNRLVNYLLDKGTSVFPELSGNNKLYELYPDYSNQYKSPIVIDKHIEGVEWAKRYGLPAIDSRYNDKFNTTI